MTKTVPKLKPLATKKNKLPMTILSLLGLALLLVGIISVIGLMQINQDGRGQANEDNDRIQAKIEADRKRNRENERARRDRELKQLGQPVEIKGYCRDGIYLGVDFKNENGGADKYVMAFNSNKYVPGSADCPNPVQGCVQTTRLLQPNGSVKWEIEWALKDGIQSISGTTRESARGPEKDKGCNTKNSLCFGFAVAIPGHTYDTIAVRAFRNGQNKVGQTSVNLKCN